MSAVAAAETQNQTSEIPHEAAQASTQAVQIEPPTEPPAESQTETQTVQAPIQPEGDIAIDDSTSAYSDEV